MFLPSAFLIPSAFALPMSVGGSTYGGFVRVTAAAGTGFVRQTP